jgi:hypothetical protein
MKLVIDGSMSVSGSSLHLKVAVFSIELIQWYYRDFVQ